MRLDLMGPDRKKSSPTESDFRWNGAREHSGADRSKGNHLLGRYVARVKCKSWKSQDFNAGGTADITKIFVPEYNNCTPGFLFEILIITKGHKPHERSLKWAIFTEI